GGEGVFFWPVATMGPACAGGGIGRRARLRALWAVRPVEVQVLSSAPRWVAPRTTGGAAALDDVRRERYLGSRTSVRSQGGRSMLTDRQRQIWEFIVDYVDAHGYPPTVREIGEAVGLASPSTVHAHLANLERAGLLRRDPTKPR